MLELQAGRLDAFGVASLFAAGQLVGGEKNGTASAAQLEPAGRSVSHRQGSDRLTGRGGAPSA